jgi:hypothetical protein
MTSSARLASQAELDALETRMGELASLLSEVADALTSYPESIQILDETVGPEGAMEATTIALRAREWPSIQEIEQLLANWRRLRDISDKRSSR